MIVENKESFKARLTPYLAPDFVLDCELAYTLAKFGHRAQVRKEMVDGKPQRYFEHVRRVAINLLDVAKICDRDMICAAILHDLIEDSAISSQMIQHSFGTEVVQMVICLSKIPKEGYHERLSKCSNWKTLVIKACDRLDNLNSLEQTSLEFKKRQIKETKEIYFPLFDKMLKMCPEDHKHDLSHLRDEIHRIFERNCVMIELEEKR